MSNSRLKRIEPNTIGENPKMKKYRVSTYYTPGRKHWYYDTIEKAAKKMLKLYEDKTRGVLYEWKNLDWHNKGDSGAPLGSKWHYIAVHIIFLS